MRHSADLARKDKVEYGKVSKCQSAGLPNIERHRPGNL